MTSTRKARNTPAANAGVLYLTGYQKGWKPSALLEMAEQLGAVVADIRLIPSSPNPDWRHDNLERVLGERYIGLRALGNQNYSNPGAPVKLWGAAGGLLQLSRLLDKHGAVIALCACKTGQTCHRATVARLMLQRRAGLKVLEISPDYGKSYEQMKLL